MRIFADKKTIKQILNSKTEAHSYPLWTVGERANNHNFVFYQPLQNRPKIKDCIAGSGSAFFSGTCFFENLGPTYHHFDQFEMT